MFDHSAFSRALSLGTGTVSRIQLTFVGALGAGKTNLCNNLVEPGFDSKSDSTVGIDFRYTSTTLDQDDSEPSDPAVGPVLTRVSKGWVASSTIADIMQQADQDTSSARQHDENARVDEQGLVCDAVDSAGTVEQPSLSSAPPVFKQEEGLVEAATFDVEKRARDAALRKEVEAAVCGDQSSIFIGLLDCGGQLSFSVCQTISFSADQSVFVLAYNSSIPLTEEIRCEFRQDGEHLQIPSPRMTNRDYLHLWLSTLSMLTLPSKAPPIVVVVGTFCKSINQSSTQAQLLPVLNEFEDRLSVRGPFFVDNSEPRASRMREFRMFMAGIIREQAARTAQTIPLSYLKCEWFVRCYETADYQTVSQFAAFAKIVADVPVRDVEALLRYLHAHCAVRFFDLKKRKQGEGTVYLNIPWLLGQVCKLLSITMIKPSAAWSMAIRNDIDLLKRKGILTTRLANHLWTDGGVGAGFRDHLLCILHELSLQCPVSSDGNKAMLDISPEAGPFYYAPICIQSEGVPANQAF